MRVMFISLLLSITISNALYTMEETDDGMEAIFVGQSSSVTSITPQPRMQLIKTLVGMRKLSKRILSDEKTQGSNVSDFETLSAIEIPENIKIDPEVFFEYANKQGLITASEPGWCRCTVCRRSKKKNQFQYASPAKRAEWAKIMFLIFFLNNQTGAAIIRNEFDTEVNDSIPTVNGGRIINSDQTIRNDNLLTTTVIGLENNNDVEVFDESQENNDLNGVENDDWNQRLAQQLRKSSSENEKLRQEALLKDELRKFFTERQERRSRRKEKMFFILAAITTGGLGVYLGTYFPC